MPKLTGHIELGLARPYCVVEKKKKHRTLSRRMKRRQKKLMNEDRQERGCEN
jgi:hypothetical protein